MAREMSDETQINSKEVEEEVVANRQSVSSGERPVRETDEEKRIRRYTIMLAGEIYDEIKADSDRQGRPVTDTVRQAIRLYLRIHEELRQGAELIKVDEFGNRIKLELIY